MLTYKAEIMEMLRNNVPVKEIREKFRSRSMLYECLTDYLLELADKVEETRNATRQEQTKLQETKTKREQLTSETGSLQNHVKSLNSKKESLTDAVASLHKVREALQKNVKKFRERGFTPEVLNKLREAKDIDGPELHDLLQRREKRAELKEEVASLEKKESGLISKIDTLTEKIPSIEREIASKENKLDSLEAQEAVFQDVVEVLKAAIKDGYSPQQFRTLLFWLRKLEIRGNPALSVSRLLEVVAEAKNLLTLKQEVRIVERRLDELQNSEAAARAKLESAQNLVLVCIEKAIEKGEEAIAGMGLHAKAEVSRVGSQSVDAIKAVGSAVNEAMCHDVDELARLRQEIGRLESWIEPARILSGMIQSPEILNTVPPALAIALLQNLAVWCDRFPDSYIAAVYDSAANEFRPNEFVAPRFRISALVRLAVEGITRLISKRLGEDSKGRGEWHA